VHPAGATHVLATEVIHVSERLGFHKASPAAYKAMSALEAFSKETGFDRTLLLLVKLRASQVNGCAFCIDMHWKELRAAGEKEERLYGLTTWRELSIYSARERAALAWAEAVTLLGEDKVSDAVYAEAHEAFGDKGLVDLTLVVIAINGWNRLCISFRTPPGSL